MPDLPHFLTAQRIRLAIFGGVVGLMSFGYYLQYVEGLEPCPLCITQRFFLVLCGGLALLASLQKVQRTGAMIYGALGSLAAIAGGSFSTRQLYLQSLPADEAPACGPSIDFIFETFPVSEALSILLRGDGNCAEVTWQFLGLSIPGWTLIAFIGLAIAWLLQIYVSEPTSQRN